MVSGREEPGIGITTGALASIHARHACCGLTPCACATSANTANREPSSPADLVDNVLAAADVERRVSLEVTDTHSLLDLVTCGFSVALVPQSFAVKTDRMHFVGLAGAVPAWETVTVTGNPTSAAAAALLREVHVAKSGGRSAAIIG
jgi:hypothetical protein